MRLPVCAARYLAISTISMLAAVPAIADDVHLTNGKVFEGVVAQWRGDQLVMQIPGGEMTLARASVREVVLGENGYAAFLARQRTLRERGRGTAGDWLDLARLALESGLQQPARTAALEAAALDPGLAGLAAVLADLGYAWDAGSNRWLPYPEVMRRRGFMYFDGAWLTREEAALRRAEAAARQREREAEQSARMERSLMAARVAVAEMELRRAAAPPPPAVVVVQAPQWLWPTFFVPVQFPSDPPRTPPGAPVFPAPVPAPPPPGSIGTIGHRSGLEVDILRRQPGSLFPARWSSSGGDR